MSISIVDGPLRNTDLNNTGWQCCCWRSHWLHVVADFLIILVLTFFFFAMWYTMDESLFFASFFVFSRSHCLLLALFFYLSITFLLNLCPPLKISYSLALVNVFDSKWTLLRWFTNYVESWWYLDFISLALNFNTMIVSRLHRAILVFSITYLMCLFCSSCC